MTFLTDAFFPFFPMLEMIKKERSTPWRMVSISGPLNYNKYLKGDVSLSPCYCALDAFMEKKKKFYIDIQYAVWRTFLPFLLSQPPGGLCFLSFILKNPLLSISLVLTHVLLFACLCLAVTGFTLLHLFYTLKEKYWSWDHNIKELAPFFLANILPALQIYSLESYS